MEKVRIAVIGCGTISEIYFQVLQKFPWIEVVACSDLAPDKAEARAAQFKIPKVLTVAEVMTDLAVEIILNLTTPHAHAEIIRAATSHGKHVYTEKPLMLDVAEAEELLGRAKARGLRVGCAPDTFLGGALQTCRKLIDDGWIGRPVAATAFRMGWGPETWHPAPEFYYQSGGGPLLDMGPYYLTALVSLLGPVAQVAASARISYPERIITSQPRYGQKISVEVPTHVAGLLDFQSGALATMITSFDVRGSQLPHIEIYGTTGTLSVPDPNHFGGEIRLKKAGSDEWCAVPLLFGYTENYRGLGLADMAYALRSGRQHRASGDLAYHVLEIMDSLAEAAQSERRIAMKSRCERPAPFPPGMLENTLDD